MTSAQVTVKNRAGIHARPASLIVKTANKYKSDLFFERGDTKINGKSIMGIITLGAGHKTEITVITEGEDEKDALNAIVSLFENRFEEE